MALFALCLFVGQAIGVPIAAPIVDRWGAPPVFWAAAITLPLLAFWFSAAIGRRAQLTGETPELVRRLEQFALLRRQRDLGRLSPPR